MHVSGKKIHYSDIALENILQYTGYANRKIIREFICLFVNTNTVQKSNKEKKEQDKTRKRVSFLSLKRAVWYKLNMTAMMNRWLGSLQTMSGNSKVLLTKQNVLLHLGMVVEKTLEGGIKRT